MTKVDVLTIDRHVFNIEIYIYIYVYILIYIYIYIYIYMYASSKRACTEHIFMYIYIYIYIYVNRVWQACGVNISFSSGCPCSLQNVLCCISTIVF